MAETFIGADNQGRLLFRDDETGAIRTDYIVGRGGNFNAPNTRRDAPMLGILDYMNNKAKQDNLLNTITDYIPGVGGYPVWHGSTQESLDAGGMGGPIGWQKFERGGPRTNQFISNLFEGYVPPDNYLLGRNIDQGESYMPTEGLLERTLPHIQTTDPNAPNYVKPAQNLFNIDFGGTGPEKNLFGIQGMPSISGWGGPGFGRTFDFSSDVFGDDDSFADRVRDAGRKMGIDQGVVKGDQTGVQEYYGYNKLLQLGRTGNQTIFHDTSPNRRLDNAYLTETEVANELQIPTHITTPDGKEIPRPTKDILADIDKKLDSDRALKHRFSKTSMTVDSGYDSKYGVRDLFSEKAIKERAAKAEKESKRVADEENRKELAKRRQGYTIYDKVMNIFDDPYGEDNLTTTGPFTYTEMVDGVKVTKTVDGLEVTSKTTADYERKEDQKILKDEGLLGEEVKEKKDTPFMTGKQATDLLRMYLTYGSLLSNNQTPPKIGYTPGAQTGLKLGVPDLYKKRRT